MDRKEYLLLLEKYKSGEISAIETERLFRYINEVDVNQFKGAVEDEHLAAVKERILLRIEKSRSPARVQVLTHWRYAAAIMLLFITSAVFLFVNKVKNNNSYRAMVRTEAKEIIKSSRNRATLTLADGTVIDLDSVSNGTLASKTGLQLTKKGNGQLSYQIFPSAAQLTDVAKFNTLSTPKGGQYEIILPDGTQVWLNASSSLQFPVQFAGNERHVKLQGEAYFEVAKNKEKPFTVSAGDADIKVLGTHFNIAAYDDDGAITTTLLEGSVALSGKGNSTILKPGQQGIISNGKDGIRLQNIDTDDVIAWKNGYFSFKNESLVSVMNKIARWYDVTVEYHGNLQSVTLGGTVSRTSDLKELLHKLSTTNAAHFHLSDGKIIVSP